MKNKTIILTADQESIMNTELGEKYTAYAKENDLNLVAVIHYAFAMPFASPEVFVDEVMKAKPDVILTDEVVFYMPIYIMMERFIRCLKKEKSQ